MVEYVIARVCWSIVIILLVSMVVFLATFLSGDPVLLLLPSDATPEEAEALREAMGFNDPIPVQYLMFIRRAICGDFGLSLRHNLPALTLVKDKLPATVELSIFGMVFALALGIPLGVIAAVRRNFFIDSFIRVISLIGQSMASFWLGIMLIYVFAVTLGWFPSFGRGGIKYLVLPGITLGTRLLAMITRLTRSTMLDVLNEDYIRTARAKGLTEAAVLFKHAFRNAIIPVFTATMMQFGMLMGGTVIIETVFMWPGVGLLTIQAIINRDYPVVQASVFILALSILVINLCADILYTYLDPRIRIR